jgi:hypothetical protein
VGQVSSFQKDRQAYTQDIQTRCKQGLDPLPIEQFLETRLADSEEYRASIGEYTSCPPQTPRTKAGEEAWEGKTLVYVCMEWFYTGMNGPCLRTSLTLAKCSKPLACQHLNACVICI